MIKFRAWDKETKIMIDVSLIDFKKRELVGEHWKFGETNFMSFDEIELMKSTGLFDRNGQEIFEGDILYGYAGEDFWEIVEFDTEEGKWIRKDIWYNSKLGLSENNEFMEIVGNIYENPELLEVKE